MQRPTFDQGLSRSRLCWGGEQRKQGQRGTKGVNSGRSRCLCGAEFRLTSFLAAGHPSGLTIASMCQLYANTVPTPRNSRAHPVWIVGFVNLDMAVSPSRLIIAREPHLKTPYLFQALSEKNLSFFYRQICLKMIIR